MTGLDKRVASYSDELNRLKDGMTILAGGFGLCGIPENLAEKYMLPCEEQDIFALRSQKKGGAAVAAGYFVPQIAPVQVRLGLQSPRLIDTDE